MKKETLENFNGKHIVVIDQGFVLMGEIEHEDATCLRLANADCIRVWGTSQGLGQIALKGPTKDTTLDPVGVAEIYHHSLIMKIPCVY